MAHLQAVPAPWSAATTSLAAQQEHSRPAAEDSFVASQGYVNQKHLWPWIKLTIGTKWYDNSSPELVTNWHHS